MCRNASSSFLEGFQEGREIARLRRKEIAELKDLQSFFQFTKNIKKGGSDYFSLLLNRWIQVPKGSRKEIILFLTELKEEQEERISN